MSYFEIYKQRVNRWGNDYQSRIQGEREHNFDLYLLKSLYRVEFKYNHKIHVGSLERLKQNDTKLMHHLLVHVDLKIPNGTILELTDIKGKKEPWMVYYLEAIKASGYNRYVMLKMTHFLTWTARDNSVQTSWAYMYGQEDNMLKDEIRSRSRMDTIYSENLKSSFFIMPRNAFLKKDDYFIIGEKPFQEYYRVTGYDLQSSEGVEYVTVDPVYEFDLTPPPVRPEDPTQRDETETDENFFWLEGGINNGNS